MKTILSVHSTPRRHWVGDGFPVRSLFSYHDHGRDLSPFLLLDHAGPMRFGPAGKPRGVGQHPHRGFETVTIVYEGEVEHRDSTGAGGLIGPGDVQWMTAGAGILHEEFHSRAFTGRGGMLEMMQLWVNLPEKDKSVSPGYQTLAASEIPSVPLPGAAGRVRVIAGEFDGHAGPARTFTPMQVWDLRMAARKAADFRFADGHSLALVVLHGVVQVNGVEIVREGQLVTFSRQGTDLHLEANGEATVLVLSGEPIDEPVIGYGPFVMNDEEGIRQAIEDFNSGRFGGIPGRGSGIPEH